MLRSDAHRTQPLAAGRRPGGAAPQGRCSPGLLAVVLGSVLAGGLDAAAQAQEPVARPTPISIDPSAVAAPALAAEPAVSALVAEASRACRAALQARFSATSQQLETWLVPTQAIAIESGDAPLAVLRRQGLAFGWMVRGRPDPLPIGVCRTNGAGAVAAIEEQKD